MQIGLGLFTGQAPPDSGRTFSQEYREVLDLVRLAETLGRLDYSGRPRTQSPTGEPCSFGPLATMTVPFTDS